MAEGLYGAFPANKRSLEISDGDWVSREDEILSFFNLTRRPSPEAVLPAGVYVNEALGFVIKVEGLSFTDPTGQTRKLLPKSVNEFNVDWLPTVLRFESDQVVITGSQICERWTATGTVYRKVE